MTAAAPPSPSTSPAPILPLSAETRSLLRSSHLLQSLSLCVGELVDNSLDSSASHVHVSLHPSTFSFSVTDNGHGLSLASMQLVGRRHFTSKADARAHPSHPPYLGLRGEALSSLAAVATVDVHSTPRFDPSSSPPRTHHKRLSSAGTSTVTSSPASHCAALGRHGTSVTVRHLFSAIPVRRRALMQRTEREVERVRRRVERLALVHPAVTLTLVDEDAGRVLVHKGRVKDVQATFAVLYRADLAAALLPLEHRPAPPSPLSCVALHVSSLTSGYHLRDYQLLYVNGRPVHHLPILRLIQHIWMRCVRLYSGGTLHTHGGSTSLTGLDGRPLYPVWVCELALDEAVYDCLSEADKTLLWFEDEELVLQHIRDCLWRGMIEHYPLLQAHEAELLTAGAEDRRQRPFETSPASAGVEAETATASPTGRRTPASPQPIIDLTDSGLAPTSARPLAVSLAPASTAAHTIDLSEDVPPEAAVLATFPPASGLPVSLSPPPLQLRLPRSAAASIATTPRRQWRSATPSVDRKAKRLLDLSSALPRPARMELKGKRRRSSSVEERKEPTPLAPVDLAPSDAALIDLTSDPVEVEMKDCTRPVSPHRLSPVPLPQSPAAAARPVSGESMLYQRLSSSAGVGATGPTFDAPAPSELPSFRLLDSSEALPLSSPVALHRSQLSQLRVLGQVDCKFLVCAHDSGLVLAVDQHAADERVRLEDLETHLDRLLHSSALPAPVPLHLTPLEGRILTAHRAQVEGWGWRLHMDGESTEPTLKPLLLAVPAVLTSALEAMDLQLYLAQLSQSFHPPSRRQLPVVLLHLLHSRACKTAIRFGDALNGEQRMALMRALARCELPFQCAHGRPSMAPLVQIEQGGKETEGQWGEERSWQVEARRRLRAVRVTRAEVQEAGGGAGTTPDGGAETREEVTVE